MTEKITPKKFEARRVKLIVEEGKTHNRAILILGAAFGTLAVREWLVWRREYQLRKDADRDQFMMPLEDFPEEGKDVPRAQD